MWRSLAGKIQIKLISADIGNTLNLITNAGIILYNTEFIDEITVQLSVNRVDFRSLCRICKSSGDSLQITRLDGIYWAVKSLLKRPVFIIGVLLFISLSVYLPTKVLFVRVEGNSLIPSRRILEAASHCGIYFGSERQSVRNEKVKNALLESMPELQWAGINTNGCVAVITVREREASESPQKNSLTSSIVASRDGMIVEYTVTRGNLSCKIGQAVQMGQVLISGYTDCGLSIRAEHAEGDVFARTERQISVISPLNWSTRLNNQSRKEKYGMIFGKKRINFYKDSGISDASCVRMYEENYVSLPGGFILPIAFTKETTYQADLVDEAASEAITADLLSTAAEGYLRNDMVAGRILQKEESITQNNEICRLNGQYSCVEMIGVQRYEEIMKPYGTHN